MAVAVNSFTESRHRRKYPASYSHGAHQSDGKYYKLLFATVSILIAYLLLKLMSDGFSHLHVLVSGADNTKIQQVLPTHYKLHVSAVALCYRQWKDTCLR
jgi:hypothetical protein